MTNELIITRGLPASGKSTWAHAWQAESPATRVVICRDDTRKAMFGSADQDYYRAPALAQREAIVTEANTHAIQHALKAGFSVCVADTNLPVRRCRDLARLAVAAGVPWRTVEFEDAPLALCLSRNAARTDKEPVPEDAIREMYNRYLRGGLAPVPTDVGEADTYADIVPVQSTFASYGPAYIFDIDGTLAHMDGRSPYDYTRVGEDVVDRDVARMVKNLSEVGYAILIVSGRKAECYDDTVEWLDNNGIRFDELFMRADGDDRKDWKVKYDIFNEHIRNQYRVVGVFDDRDQVVKMWRALGLKCFQVAPGDF